MFRTRGFSIGIRAAMLAIILMMFAPINSFAQRRWVVVRSPRSRIVVHQPRRYVVYQRRPYYTYQDKTYGYPQSYYTTGYYSYRYSQPYFANRYSYSFANPTYRHNDRYDDGWRYRRHRHNQVRLGVWLR